MHSVSGFAADLHIDSFPFPGLLGEVGVGPLVVRFVADDVDGAGSVVVFDLPQPVVYALDGAFVGEIDEEHDEVRLLVDLVSDLEEVHPSAHIPKCNVDGLVLEGEMLVD